MNSKKNIRYYFYLLIGIAVLVIGAYLAKQNRESEGIMASLPYILIGIGSGTFGHSLGTILRNRSYAKHPDEAKRMEIEEKDERNVMIRNKAKARAYDVMIYTFGALMMSYALFNADLYVTLSIVAAYLFVVGINLYYVFKFSKEM